MIMNEQTYQRGTYKEIVFKSLPERQQSMVKRLVFAAAKAEKVDEHGNWDFGANLDKKRRGSALNWDLYAIGKDCHNKKLLAVIQIRQYFKRNTNWYPRIRKSYFLLGRNEDNTVFAHPVESRVIHSAIAKDKDVLLAVQSWIFSHDYQGIIRQGDLAVIPSKRYKELREAEKDSVPQQRTIQGSHRLYADAIAYRNDNLYALNIYLEHLPHTHPTIQQKGWFKIVVGQRSSFYDFAVPTID